MSNEYLARLCQTAPFVKDKVGKPMVGNGVSSAISVAKATAGKIGDGISNGISSTGGTAKKLAGNIGSAISNGRNWLTGKKK